MIKNEFSENCQDLRINPAEATIVVRVLSRDLRIYDRSCALLLLYIFFKGIIIFFCSVYI